MYVTNLRIGVMERLGLYIGNEMETVTLLNHVVN